MVTNSYLINKKLSCCTETAQMSVLFTSDKGEGTCFCLFVCLSDYSKTHGWIWIKCCVSTDVGTRRNWLTFEPEPDHSLDGGTGFLSRISYTLRNFAALPSLAYFSPFSVSMCAKLARSILMRNHNTAVEPIFENRFLNVEFCRRKKLSCRFRTSIVPTLQQCS